MLLLDSGGTLFRGGDSFTSENPKLGALLVAAMNAMGYDAMALGPQELKAPLSTVQSRLEEAEFPILSANATPGRMLPNVQPFVLHKVGDHTVAVIGLTPVSAGDRLVALGLPPLAPDPIAAVERAARRAGRRADIVVLLSTMDRSSLETIAQSVPEVDVIIGRGLQLRPVAVPGVEGEVVFQASGSEGKYLGLLTLQLDAQGRVTDFAGRATSLTEHYPDDPDIVELIREHARNP